MNCKWVSQTLIRTDFLSLAEWKIILLVPKIVPSTSLLRWAAGGGAQVHLLYIYLPLSSLCVPWAEHVAKHGSVIERPSHALNYLRRLIAFLKRSARPNNHDAEVFGKTPLSLPRRHNGGERKCCLRIDWFWNSHKPQHDSAVLFILQQSFGTIPADISPLQSLIKNLPPRKIKKKKNGFRFTSHSHHCTPICLLYFGKNFSFSQFVTIMLFFFNTFHGFKSPTSLHLSLFFFFFFFNYSYSTRQSFLNRADVGAKLWNSFSRLIKVASWNSSRRF